MTMPAIDPEYAQLLEVFQPKTIHSKKVHARRLAQIAEFMKVDERKLSHAERDMLELLLNLVRDYEQAKFPVKKSDPAETLAFLMEENELKPADLPLPASRISEILARKREISKSQAIALAEFFHVSPAVFIAG